MAHMAKLDNLLNALLKNGLKISPKKCQLFKMELQYIGKVIFIKDRKVHMGEEQQDAFEGIKCRLIKPPILHMPNYKG